MANKKKIEHASNMEALRNICTKPCTEEQAMDLKKFYMNKHGNRMAGTIGSILFMEFLFIFFLLNTGIDKLWEGIPYAETIIYGIAWGSGGLYLAHMLVTVIRDTYYLKLALEAGEVKTNECEITFHDFKTYNESKKNTLHLYIKQKRMEEIWVYTHKSKTKSGLTYNVSTNEHPGTKLLVYSVNDKKRDVFVMVKDKKIEDSADKVLSDILNDKLVMTKAQFHVQTGGRFYNTNTKKKNNKKKKK